MNTEKPAEIRPFQYSSFQHFLSEGKLMGSRCLACGEFYLPPRAICRKCQSDQMEWIAFSGKGKLATFTAIYVGQSSMVEQGFDRTNPYVSAIIELDEGACVSARLLGVDARHPEAIQIGMPVEIEYPQDNKNLVLAFRPSV